MDPTSANGNARDNALLRQVLICLWLFLTAPALTRPDGGTVQLQQRAGPFVVTMFSEPTPVRVGMADLSILCQRSTDQRPVSGAQVLLYLRKPSSGDITEFVMPVRASKNNPELYAVSTNLPTSGRWPVRISIKKGADEALIHGALMVLPPQPAVVAYWPYFTVVPLVALLFAINLRLRKGRARKSI